MRLVPAPVRRREPVAPEASPREVSTADTVPLAKVSEAVSPEIWPTRIERSAAVLLRL
jgi:hypothetical protein